MKERLKKMVKNHPVIEKSYRVMVSDQKFSDTRITKHVKGRGNVYEIDRSALLFNCTFDIIGSNNTIEICKSVYLKSVRFIVRGDNNIIRLGQHVRFNGGGSFWVEGNGCRAVIGENTTFEDVHIAVTEPDSSVLIGDDCMFAYDIDLRTGDSHTIIDLATNERINYAQDIVIGNHVWIASHVSVLKGVKISDNSIVATRAVVTKAFPEKNILIGGVPAKKMKENINWDRKMIFKKSTSNK
jgi:acetyltransferase-like isoleucine patch superfamily enzyme